MNDQEKIKDLEGRIARARKAALKLTRLSRHFVGLDDTGEKVVTVAKMGVACGELLAELCIKGESAQDCIREVHGRGGDVNDLKAGNQN